MKRFMTICLGAALTLMTSMSFTSCIDEVEPTDGASDGQVTGSESAVASLVSGLNSYATNIWNTTQFPASFGYLWGIERSGFFNGREKWAKGFENQRV